MMLVELEELSLGTKKQNVKWWFVILLMLLKLEIKILSRKLDRLFVQFAFWISLFQTQKIFLQFRLLFHNVKSIVKMVTTFFDNFIILTYF